MSDDALYSGQQMQLETDLEPIRTALYDAANLVDRLPTTPQIREILRERLFGGPQVLEQLVSSRSEIRTAGNTKRIRIIFEPSDLLLRYVGTLRTGEWMSLTLDHGPSAMPQLF